MKHFINYITEKQNFLVKGHTKTQDKDMRNIYYYESDTPPFKKVYLMELKSNKELEILANKPNMSAEFKKSLNDMYDMWPERSDLIIWCGFAKKNGQIKLEYVGDKAVIRKNIKPVAELDFNDFSEETWINNNWIV